MAKRKKGSLANPMLLAPRDAEDNAIIQVIIETPKGSRNKYAFDADQKVFELTKVLPATERSVGKTRGNRFLLASRFASEGASQTSEPLTGREFIYLIVPR